MEDNWKDSYIPWLGGLVQGPPQMELQYVEGNWKANDGVLNTSCWTRQYTAPEMNTRYC